MGSFFGLAACVAMVALSMLGQADPAGGILQYARDFGALGVIVVVLVMILRGDLVPKRYMEALIKDRDEWKTRALRGTRLAEEAVNEIEHIVPAPAPRPRSPRRKAGGA